MSGLLYMYLYMYLYRVLAGTFSKVRFRHDVSISNDRFQQFLLYLKKVSMIFNRVDSRLRECDNYAFLAVLAPNFKFPAWLLPQNAKIWRNSSNPVHNFGHSVCISIALFYSINSINFRQSRPLTRLNFYWLMLKWAFLLSFLQKWLSYLHKEMQK